MNLCNIVCIRFAMWLPVVQLWGDQMSYSSSFVRTSSQPVATGSTPYCDVCKIPFKTEQVYMHLQLNINNSPNNCFKSLLTALENIEIWWSKFCWWSYWSVAVSDLSPKCEVVDLPAGWVDFSVDQLYISIDCHQPDGMWRPWRSLNGCADNLVILFGIQSYHIPKETEPASSNHRRKETGQQPIVSLKPATDESGCSASLPGHTGCHLWCPSSPAGPFGSSVMVPVQRRFSVKNPLQCNAVLLPGWVSQLLCRSTCAARPTIVRCFPFRYTYLFTIDVTSDDRKENDGRNGWKTALFSAGGWCCVLGRFFFCQLACAVRQVTASSKSRLLLSFWGFSVLLLLFLQYIHFHCNHSLM